MIPVALAGLGVAVAWVLSRHRNGDLTGAARDAVFAELRDGVFVLDPQGQIADLNQTAERILGTTASDARGRPAAELFAGRLQPVLDAVRAPGTPFELELAGPGEPRVYAVRAVPLADGLAGVLGQVLVLRDITAYRHAQTLLHATFLAEASAELASSLDFEATLQRVARLALPALGDWCTVYMVAEDREIRRVAVAYTDGEKARLAEALRRYPPSPVSPRSSVAEAMRTRQSILTARIPETYVESIAQDPEHLEIMRRLAFRSSMTVPLQARGDVLGALAFFSSDPDRRYDATDLALAEDLARRAGLALDNARLYSEAQRAIRARDEFLSVAAHELKTPLTTMLGYAQMLIRYMQPGSALDQPIVERALLAIEQQSERLTRLVSRLLDIARIEGGRLRVEPAVADLVPLVTGVVETIRATAQNRTLVAQVPDRLVGMVDALRFEQVLTNLLDNAVKFSPPGTEIVVELAETAVGMARLTVTDRGPGIPAEHRDRIFDRFYQAHSGTFAAGMGLGLYISRQIVEQHGGSIRAEQPPKGGARFVVMLPLKPAARERNGPARSGETDS
jgi:PAS domain S-box-containing protein